jgi:hypothetical protein
MPFKKGVSGNPGGKPKGEREYKNKLLPLEHASIEALQLDLEDPDKRGAAARYILDHLYGKPVQKNEISGDDGGPLVAVIREG